MCHHVVLDHLDDIWRRLHAGAAVDGWDGHECEDWDVISQLEPHRIWVRDSQSPEWFELKRTGNSRE